MNYPSQTSGTGVAFTQDESVAAHAESAGDVFVREWILAIRGDLPSWLDDRLAQIDGLRNLEPNWDSYGAQRVDLMSIELAREAVKHLAHIDTVEEPTVTAAPDGKVALCWDDGERSLDVEICPDGWLDFSYMNESREIPDEEGRTQVLEYLVVLLTQF